MKGIVWKYGLLAGLIVSVFMAFNTINCCKNPENMMGTIGMIIGYASMILAFSLIFVAVKKYRDTYLDGAIGFGKALGIGLLIALIASTLYVITWAFVYHFVVPEFMDVYTTHMLKQAETVSSPAEFEEKAREMAQFKEMYRNPLMFALMTYAEILPVGILAAVVCALILKRKQPKPGEPLPA